MGTNTGDLGSDYAHEPPEIEEIEHGMGTAYYNNLPGPQQTPTIECLCGEVFKGSSWMDCGWMLDEHLKEIQKPKGTETKT